MRVRLALLVLVTLCCVGTIFAQSIDSVKVKVDLPMADYSSPKLYILNKIEIKGVQYLDPEILATTTGLIKGDSIYLPSDYISQAAHKLWSQRYFSNVEILAHPVGDSLNIEILLGERQRVYKWDFKGLKKGEITTLNEDLKLRRGVELSDYNITTYSNSIQKFLNEKGYLNAQVGTIVKADTSIKNGTIVTFDVQRGEKVKIGEIVFNGNEVFPDKRLKSALKKTTSKKDIRFWKSSKLKKLEYEDDKESLIDYYNSKGYRNANIVSDSIYKINDKRIGIAINVDEGNKYYFRNIAWVGNSKYATEDLENMLGLQPNDAYDKKSIEKRLGIGKEQNPDDMSITSLYQNNGYLFFRVEPTETIIGEDSIDLDIKIFEGKQATINEVVITGNNKIDDDVIRRELQTRPGDLYDRSMLMNTLRLLSQMKHFNPENIQPGINPVSAELVDISWPLEEQASDKFEISGGWGANMFVGSVGIELNNISLKNFFKKGSWRPYPQGQSQQLVLRAQSNGSYYKSFQLSLTEPWLGGKKPTSLTVSAYYSEETNAYYMWNAGTKHFRTVGTSVGSGRRLSWPDPYFTLYSELSYQQYNLKDWDNRFIIANGTCNIFALKLVFARNSVDQPIYPRRGSEFSVGVTLTPPYSLFDGKDYSNKAMSNRERYKWIEYHKWSLKGQWFTPISRNNNLVLMTKAEMGYLGAYDSHKKSPFEGFELGGDGMSGYNLYGVDIIGMRGYENGAVTPGRNSNSYANVYNKYTVELRYPFILKPSSTIYAVAFGEAGNAFNHWNEFNPFLLKRSLGAGVRIYLPIVGMIGVDWGYGFDNSYANPNKKSGSQLHFMIGTQF